jgi:hypothetical protein
MRFCKLWYILLLGLSVRVLSAFFCNVSTDITPIKKFLQSLIRYAESRSVVVPVNANVIIPILKFLNTIGLTVLSREQVMSTVESNIETDDGLCLCSESDFSMLCEAYREWRSR